MLTTLRDAFRAVRQAIGTRNTLLLVVVFVLLIPFILVFALLGYFFGLLGKIGSWVIGARRGVGKHIIDPVFGPATYRGYSVWHVERELNALGGRLIIAVPGSRTTGPSHAHRELLEGIVERQHEIRRQVEESIFRQYQNASSALREHSKWLSEQYRAQMPVLEEPAQIWTLLSNGQITLDDYPGWFSITWDCTWDPEYADVARNFVDWKLDDDEGS